MTRKIRGKSQSAGDLFSSRRRLEKGIYLEDGNIVYCRKTEKVCHVDELKTAWAHNYENVMAAVAGGSVSRSVENKNLRQWNIG